MKRLGRLFICLFASLSLMMSLTACKDNSYSDLHITDNATTISEACRVDSTFTAEEAREFAKLLADQDVKKIKTTKELTGGNVKKILLTDTNGATYIIIMADDKVTSLQDTNGQNLYIRTITKKKGE